MSCKFREIIKKWAKPNLSPDVTPRPANFYGEYFPRIGEVVKWNVVKPDPPELSAVFLAIQDSKNRGEGGVICGLI